MNVLHYILTIPSQSWIDKQVIIKVQIGFKEKYIVDREKDTVKQKDGDKDYLHSVLREEEVYHSEKKVCTKENNLIKCLCLMQLLHFPI